MTLKNCIYKVSFWQGKWEEDNNTFLKILVMSNRYQKKQKI